MSKPENPRITVLMPVYNCELYINEAVDSILNQSFQDFELLIIDDASNDKTVSILKSYNDKRIKLVEKPVNTGLTNSLNLGLELAKGEYIARMDGDDISLPERFARQVALLDTDPDLILCGTLYQIIGTEKICNHPLTHNEIKVKLISGCYIAHPTVMFRRSIFESYKIQYDPQMEPAEDYDLWTRLVFLGKTANIGEVLLYYRVHLKQTSVVFNEKQKKITQDISSGMLEKLDPSFNKEVYFLDLKSTSLNQEGLLRNLIMKVKLLNSLHTINNKSLVYDKEIFSEFINYEKNGLVKLYLKIAQIYSLANLIHVLNHIPDFFTIISFKESVKFIIRSIFHKKIRLIHSLKRLKYSLKEKFSWIQFKYSQLVNYFSNRIVRNQNADFKSIPIIIISFNQLLYLKKLIEFLRKNEYNNIVIIDNNSTYEPLIAYFKDIESTVTIHRLKDNHGHLVFWENQELFEQYSRGYYVVTDADINPDSGCPKDFLRYFKSILDSDNKVTKVGFSLKLDDIPESNLYKQRILTWESQFWNTQKKDGNFNADIDTTFALYRPKYKYNIADFYKGCRTKMPYIARHGGWYIDNRNLTEEQKFYFANCNESSSWRINPEGIMTNQNYLK